jgi:hypothetical protein
MDPFGSLPYIGGYQLILFWAGRMGARSVPKVPKVEIVRARVDSAPWSVRQLAAKESWRTYSNHDKKNLHRKLHYSKCSFQ